MIRDHHPDTRGGRGAHGLDRGDAAVTGDDQPSPHRFGLPEPGRPEVVSIPQPVRHEPLDLGASQPKGPGQNRDRGLPVHVIIAVHQDQFAGPHRPDDRLHRCGHPR
jgi:hypothetical protein